MTMKAIMALRKAMVSSQSNEWSTPQSFFDQMNREFAFTLDPCASSANAKCQRFFGVEDDGLKQSWANEIVFMNPPYGGNTRKWVRKAWRESQQGAVVVCLLVAGVDRSYWHDYIFPYASEIRWLRGRLHFGDSKFSAPFASVVVIFDGKRALAKQKQVYEKRGEPACQEVLL